MGGWVGMWTCMRASRRFAICATPRASRRFAICATPRATLTRHDERVGEEVGVDHAVEDVGGAIVGGRGKEGVGTVEGGAAHRELVVAQRAVGLGGQVQVVPAVCGWGGGG